MNTTPRPFLFDTVVAKNAPPYPSVAGRWDITEEAGMFRVYDRASDTRLCSSPEYQDAISVAEGCARDFEAFPGVLKSEQETTTMLIPFSAALGMVYEAIIKDHTIAVQRDDCASAARLATAASALQSAYRDLLPDGRLPSVGSASR